MEDGYGQTEEMNEIIITIMLVVPSPDKMVDWSVNEVPTQIQIKHESGLEVSYHSNPVPCSFKTRSSSEMVFKSDDNHCYSIYDIHSPQFIRHKSFWYRISLLKPPHDKVTPDGRR